MCNAPGCQLEESIFGRLSLIPLDNYNTDSLKEGDQLETFMYEFVKLFGKHGGPEYAIGTVQFGDFLHTYAKESDENAEYYQMC